MIVVEFHQPAPHLNLNARTHWAKKARWTREWRKAAWAAAASTGQRDLGPSTVTCFLPVVGNLRRDPSNWVSGKPCIDGLKDAGFWPDDSAEWVAVTEPVLVVGAKTVRIEVRPR